ncbi:hypothetical protein SRIMM317S_04357 [Streptomyces rimosus subsp. rimosus]
MIWGLSGPPPADSCSSARRLTRSSRWESTSSGARSRLASACTAVRSRPMVAAACSPWPTTSPTTRATRALETGMTSTSCRPHARGGVGGQIAVGDLDGELFGQFARQQAALEGQRAVVLLGVAAGVVDADGGAGDELLGQEEVVLLERLGAFRAPQAHQAEHQAAGGQRHDDQRVGAQAQGLFGALRVLDVPAGAVRQVRFEDRLLLDEALRLWCPGAKRNTSPTGARRPDPPPRRTVRPYGGRARPVPRVGSWPRVTGSSRSTETASARSGTATSASSRAVCATSSVAPMRRRSPGKDGEPVLGPVPVGAVFRHLGDAEHLPAGGVPHPERGHGHDAFPAGVDAQPARLLGEDQRAAGLQYPAQPLLDGGHVRADEEVLHAQAPVGRGGAPADARDGPVDTEDAQVGGVYGQPDGRVAEQALQYGAVDLPLGDLGRARGDDEPLVRVVAPDDGPDPEAQLDALSVAVQQRQDAGPAPVAACRGGGLGGRCPVVVVQQEGVRAPPQHLLRPVAEQVLGASAPARDRAPLVEHRRSRPAQRERVLRALGELRHRCVHRFAPSTRRRARAAVLRRLPRRTTRAPDSRGSAPVSFRLARPAPRAGGGRPGTRPMGPPGLAWALGPSRTCRAGPRSLRRRGAGGDLPEWVRNDGAVSARVSTSCATTQAPDLDAHRAWWSACARPTALPRAPASTRRTSAR